ncbi:MAG: rhodanese-like domain-containing protein [Candidatus Helarchaeota archaeon]
MKNSLITAKHILISEMNKERLSKIFGEDELIITYSLDYNCPASKIAAEKLQKFGYQNVLRYRGGWKEWKDSKFPTT